MCMFQFKKGYSQLKLTCNKADLTKFEIYLEASGAPVNKLNTALALDSGNSSVDILGDNIAAVQHAASHVLAVPEEAE